MRKTLLIVPTNDAEAVMILRLAKIIGLSVIISAQPHGASLDKEPKIIGKIKKSGARRVVIVEMPGVKIEEKIKKLGLQVRIIDHHRYGKLNRKKLKSSLEQFLEMFDLSDRRLREFGFEAPLVRGIGILDRGFIEGLRREGYSVGEIKKIFAYQKKLLRPFVDPREEKKYDRAAAAAWKNRQKRNGHFIVIGHTKEGFRRHLSHHVFEKIGQAAPIVLDERGRGMISVQSSPAAERLFKRFGGFTFGEKGNWGYKNGPGRRKITLKDVLRFL